MKDILAGKDENEIEVMAQQQRAAAALIAMTQQAEFTHEKTAVGVTPTPTADYCTLMTPTHCTPLQTATWHYQPPTAAFPCSMPPSSFGLQQQMAQQQRAAAAMIAVTQQAELTHEKTAVGVTPTPTADYCILMTPTHCIPSQIANWHYEPPTASFQCSATEINTIEA